ncbi:MAG: AAA family ATPase [Myxococcota bacterium]
MVSLFEPPGPPDFRVDLSALRHDGSWGEALYACPQNPKWHAEGDVGTHTEMVCEALVADPRYRSLDESARQVVWLAAVLHDVAKPRTTTRIDGEIRQPHHSRVGARLARRLLWEAGVPFAIREAACAIIRYHQVPFWLIDQDDARGRAVRMSQSVRCDWLGLVARADAIGRTCDDQQWIVDQTELFEAFCAELGCLEAPWPFASDAARVRCGLDVQRDPLAPGEPFPTFDVVLMSGLPASGKSTWLSTHRPGWPVVSLDRLRHSMKIDPRGPQGRVVQAAKEAARVHLRAKQSFAWDATNLNADRRTPLIQMAVDYGARVHIVVCETPPAVLHSRNRSREAVVPAKVIERMVDRWESPTWLEAHERTVVESDALE